MWICVHGYIWENLVIVFCTQPKKINEVYLFSFFLFKGQCIQWHCTRSMSLVSNQFIVIVSLSSCTPLPPTYTWIHAQCSSTVFVCVFVFTAFPSFLFCFLSFSFFFKKKRKVGLWGKVHSPVTNDWPQACSVRKWWETLASFAGWWRRGKGKESPSS